MFFSLRSPLANILHRFGSLRSPIPNILHRFGSLRSPLAIILQRFGSLRSPFANILHRFGSLRSQIDFLLLIASRRAASRLENLASYFAQHSMDRSKHYGESVGQKPKRN